MSCDYLLTNRIDSKLCEVGGFLRFPPPIRTDCHDITEILLKVALNKQQTIVFYSVEIVLTRYQDYFNRCQVKYSQVSSAKVFCFVLTAKI
jgi:hypothetical protein